MTGSNDKTLTLVAVPAIKGHMEQYFQPLISSIEAATGYELNFVEAPSYTGAIEMLKEGRAQLAWLGQSAFMEASHEVALEPLAVAFNAEGKGSVYRSEFIVRSGAPYSRINDLKGRRLLLTEKGSTSGDIMPRHTLTQLNLNPDIHTNFSQVIYSGSQESAVRDLMADRGDVAVVSQINLEKMFKDGSLKRSDIKVIHHSDPIPGAPISAVADMEESLRKQVQAAILNAHTKGPIGGYGENVDSYHTPEEARLSFLSSYLRPAVSAATLAFIAALVISTIGVSIHLNVNPITILQSFSYFADIIGRMLPPDFSDLGALLLSMFETIEIGFLGTILATLLSIPIGLVSAKNITPSNWIYYPARLVTTFFRAVPEFILAMILVISVGFGALPGILALGLHTMGFLSKFYAEEIEHVRNGPIEAIEAAGASHMQKITFAIIPQILPNFVGYSLYIFDRNIRMATILGIVGAGGIGYRLISSFRMFEYREVSAIIIIIFITIFLLDALSSKVRHAVK